jgi:antitoxin component of RelBE/YafQ-DinJ toxin-antitoxin module
MAKKSLGLRLDADLKEKAEQVARMERRTLTNLIEVLLEQYCRRVLEQHPKDESE